MKQFFALFALVAVPALAVTVPITGTTLTTASGSPLNGFVTMRSNNCHSQAVGLLVGGIKFTTVTASVTNGAFSLSLPAASGWCYQVGVFDSGSNTARFLPGYGAYAPVAAGSFDGAPASAVPPDMSVPASGTLTSSPSLPTTPSNPATPTTPTTPTSTPTVLSIASATTLGGVKVGSGLSIDPGSGVLSSTGTGGVPLTLGVVTTGAAGSNAAATINNGILNLTLPQGTAGVNGVSPNLTVGTISPLAAGATPTAKLTGTFPNLVLSLGIPAGTSGTSGTNGLTPVLSMGSVQTLAAGSAATAAITGSAPNFQVSLGIPAGAPGNSIDPSVSALEDFAPGPSDTYAAGDPAAPQAGHTKFRELSTGLAISDSGGATTAKPYVAFPSYILANGPSQAGSALIFSDSWGQGSGASNGPNANSSTGVTDCTANAFGYGILCDYGAPAINDNGFGGDQIEDMALKVFSVLSPTVANNPTVVMLAGTNDKNVYGENADKQNISYRALTSAIAWAGIPDAAKVMTAKASVCIRSGTWANDGGKIYTTTPGSALTCTITTYGPALYYVATIADSYTGSHTISIDGITPGNDAVIANTGQNGATIATYNGSAATYALSRYSLAAGVHTVVLTHTSGLSEPMWLGSAGYPVTGTAPPSVFVADMSPQLGTQSAATQAAYVALNRLAVNTLRNDGVNATLVPIPLDPVLDFTGGTLPNGMVCPAATYPPYHPNNCGHAKIRAAFEASMKPVIRGVSGGASSTASITSGTIDGARIGGVAPAAGSFTKVDVTSPANGFAAYTLLAPNGQSTADFALGIWGGGNAAGLGGSPGFFNNTSGVFPWNTNVSDDFCTSTPVANGNVGGCAGSAHILRNDGTYQSKVTTAPTGACSVPGAFVFPLDGSIERCLNGQWSSYAVAPPAPSAATVFGVPLVDSSTPWVTLGLPGNNTVTQDNGFIAHIVPTAAIAAGSNVAFIRFGKSWVDGSGANQTPSCSLSPRAGAASALQFTADDSYNAFVMTSAQSLAANGVYDVMVTCIGTTQR